MTSYKTFPRRNIENAIIKTEALSDLQQARNVAIYRSQSSIERALQQYRSSTTSDMLCGDVLYPQAVVVIHDEEGNAVVYASSDDETFSLCYYTE